MITYTPRRTHHEWQDPLLTVLIDPRHDTERLLYHQRHRPGRGGRRRGRRRIGRRDQGLLKRCRENNLSQLIQILILPPASPILLGLAGAFLLIWHRRPAAFLLVTGILLTYLFSIPYTASLLNRHLQSYGPLTGEVLNQARPGAIVVLAGGLYSDAPEYGDDTINLRTLGRLRYAARLARQTGLPILASGGVRDEEEDPTEAELMKRVLEEDFGIQAVLTEPFSQTTWENAIYSKAVLDSLGISTIVLVTNAAHLPRAVESFQRTGIKVVPAPTLFFSDEPSFSELNAWLPSPRAVYEIHYALHEWLGRLWYLLRDTHYRVNGAQHLSGTQRLLKD